MAKNEENNEEIETEGDEFAEEAEIDLPDLDQLSDEELAAIEALLVEDFTVRTEGVEEFSAEDDEAIADLGKAIVLVREELAARTEAAETAVALAADRDEAIAAVAASTRKPVVEEAAEETVEEEAVVASAEKREFNFSPVGLKGNVKGDEGVTATGPYTLTASADVPGFKAGQELHSMKELAAAFMAKRPQIKGTDKGNDGYRYLVASIGLPENPNMLDETNSVANEETFALVASGGYCAPATPLYDMTVLGADTCRPVIASLPSYRADRGAVRFIQVPRFNAAAASTRVTTAAQDLAGYNSDGSAGKVAYKPCLAITCGSETTASLDAISRCLTFGNFGARTYPEHVEAWLKLSLAAAAKRAEEYVIDKIKAGSTAVTAASYGGYGATRSLLHQITVAAAAFRSRYRFCGNIGLAAVLPTWVKDLLRVDLANDSFDGHLWSVSDGVLEGWLSDRGVSITWYVDTPTTGTSQVFAAQSTGALNTFPANVQWGLYPTGTWHFLEGGNIDLGIVRDSTLNSTNDYQVWSEEFLGVVNRGHESLWITSTVCQDGVGPASIASLCGTPVPAA